MPVTHVRTQPVSKAVPVPGSTTLSFSAKSAGDDDVNAVVLYSVMDGAAVRIVGGGQAAPTIGRNNTTVSQLVDFDRTENPTPMLFRVRAVVSENGVEQFERVWRIRVDSTAMAEAMLETEGRLEMEEPGGRKRATKKKAGAKTKSAAKRKSATRKAGAKKTAAKKGATTKKKSAAKKSTAKKSATAKKSRAKRKSPIQRAVAGGAKKSAARRGGALKRAAKKGGAAKRRSR